MLKEFHKANQKLLNQELEIKELEALEPSIRGLWDTVPTILKKAIPLGTATIQHFHVEGAKWAIGYKDISATRDTRLNSLGMLVFIGTELVSDVVPSDNDARVIQIHMVHVNADHRLDTLSKKTFFLFRDSITMSTDEQMTPERVTHKKDLKILEEICAYALQHPTSNPVI